MKIQDKFKQLSLTRKNTIIMAIIGIIGCLILLPFAFFEKKSLVIGFALGTLIEIGCYRLLVLTSDSITKSVNGTAKTGLIIFSTFGFFIRFLLYAAGLVLAAFDTFYWGGKFVNIWTTFAGYLPMTIIVAITTLKSNKVSKESK